MAEKRKPTFVVLLRYPGNDDKPKTMKIELFPEALFRDNLRTTRSQFRRFRIRVNGKWYPKGQKGAQFFYKTTFFRILQKSTFI